MRRMHHQRHPRPGASGYSTDAQHGARLSGLDRADPAASTRRGLGALFVGTGSSIGGGGFSSGRP